MSFQIQGKVHKIQPIERISDSFEKRVLVLEYASNPEYPQYLPIEFSNKGIPQLDQIQMGQMVEIEIDLQGREWTNAEGVVKYFPSFRGWKVNSMGANVQQGPQGGGSNQPYQPQQHNNPAPPAPPAQHQQSVGGQDDMPF